ncbi:hypothetical protein FKW77_003737 [Venturia effusa]|uniref:F-box domain-containing protein n=1 Tax=Venturia effusa TaxID=50376 RepID=A0A517LGY3_9PEZI|nr:hypothetical protein FKW77_003737 [Venturia effusa]
MTILASKTPTQLITNNAQLSSRRPTSTTTTEIATAYSSIMVMMANMQPSTSRAPNASTNAQDLVTQNSISMSITKHVSKHTLLTIPTELTEAIAMALDGPDLLSLRLANKEIAIRTEKAFTAQYLTEMNWLLDDRKGKNEWSGAEILETRPDLALHVKEVCLDFGWLGGVTAMLQPIAAQLNQLPNVRTLRLYDLHGRQQKHLDAVQIQLPRLNSLVLERCSFRNVDPIISLINGHRDTLTELTLHDFCTNATKRAYWANIFEAAKILRKEAVVKIGGSEVYIPTNVHWSYISFTLLDGSAIDKELVSVFWGRKDGYRGLHYSTQAGKLHESLDCMLRNFKLYDTISAMRSAGVFVFGKPKS